jgi:hypothetical protein
MHKPGPSLFTRRGQSFKHILCGVNIMPNLRSGSYNHFATYTEQRTQHDALLLQFSRDTAYR